MEAKRCDSQSSQQLSEQSSEQLSVPYSFSSVPEKLLLDEIACKSITVVHNDGVLPLKPEQNVLIVWPEVVQRTEVDEPWSHSDSLGMVLGQIKTMFVSIR